MRSAATASIMLVLVAAVGAQRPADPALLVPHPAPPLDYVAVADPVRLPAGLTMGPPASVGFDPRGHLIVLTRGPQAFFEFDEDGRFIRTFGEGLFVRAHGMRLDAAGNIWAADVGAHVVYKLSPQGQVLLALGTKGEPGVWNEAAGARRLNQPNDVAIARNGDVYVVQGHTPGAEGDPRVLHFDRTGAFISSWGGKGTTPGRFDVAHGIAIDNRGDVWVADRENQRIQIFDAHGGFLREMKYGGLPTSLAIGSQYIFMVNGFAAQVLQMDLAGRVLAATGRPGRGLGEFDEAHFIAVSPRGELFIADTVNATLQKFVKK